MTRSNAGQPRSRLPFRLLALVAAAALALPLAIVFLPATVEASTQVRAFAPRFSANAQGSITFIGNTLETCSLGGQCANARNGTATGANLNNNNYNMIFVDVDADAATFDSSSATLALPASSSVLFAELTWGGISNSAQRGVVKLAVPGHGYVDVSATRLDASGADYSAVADVTSSVASLADANGTYWVADVQSTVNTTNQYAGWALVIAYQNLSQPLRNLTVFDGLAVVDTNAPSSVTTIVSGFLTPATGIVHTEIGTVAYEGDAGYTGDSMQLNGTALSNTLNPGDNFFNSSMTIAGTRFAAKNPDYVNQMSFDADIVNADGYLGNWVTSASFTYTTSQDVYYPTVVTFQTDVFTPQVSVVKSSEDLTHTNAIYDGDTIRYTLTASSDGNDPATFVVLRDLVPPQLTYVPGSAVIVSGPNAGAKTDAPGDDQVDFASGTLTYRLGTGADASTGGTLAMGVSTTLQFDATVNSGLPEGTHISNQASVTYSGATLGGGYSGVSDSSSTSAGPQPDTRVTNAPPVAIGDTVATLQNTPVTVDVLANDSDADGNIDPSTVRVVSGPSHGSISSIDPATGKITYAPTSGYIGADTFRYEVCDTVDQCAQADVSVTVSNSVLNPPTARPDGATTSEGTATSPAIAVLANDSAGAGASLVPATTTVVVPASSGTTSVNGTTGAITYTPTGYFYGLDSFVYQVCDNHGLCDSALVSIQVDKVDHAPTAVNDAASVAENSSVGLSVLANDTDPEHNIDTSSVAVQAGPSHGGAVAHTDGTITYTPTGGYHGSDSFTYRVCDTTDPTPLCSADATVSITVTPLAPVATADAYTVAENGSLTPTAPGVLANDTDPSSEPLTASLITNVGHGSLTLHADGSFSYSPTAGYHGSDSFTYQACDAETCSADATVSITVTQLAPVATADAYTVAENGSLTPTAPGVLANDTDPSSEPLTASLITNVGHGSLTLHADGSFSYSPTAGYHGSDSFTYQACDAETCSADATVSITVTEVPPDSPVAADDSAFVVPGHTATIQVLANDDAVAGTLDVSSLQVTGGPSYGSAAVQADGSITYSTSGGGASDSFTYRICNTVSSTCATATVHLTIDRAPSFGPDLAGSTIHLVIGGSLPGQVATSDPDAGDTVTLSFSGGLPGGWS